jgi:hypothetical protein
VTTTAKFNPTDALTQQLNLGTHFKMFVFASSSLLSHHFNVFLEFEKGNYNE